MNKFLNGVARAVSETFDLPGPVLEIGSYQVPGQQELIDLRSLFPDKPYIGLDLRPGPGVDVVGDVEAIPYPDASVGTVIAMNTFEHVRRFWKGFEEIERVLRSDGVVLVSCPFTLHIHDHPADYWRFSPRALEMLLEPYPQKIIGWHGPERRPAGVWAVAFREEARRLTPGDFDRYRTLVGRYAAEPRSWWKTARYRLGRVLCGRRPFDYYLDHNRWDSVCRTSPCSRPEPRTATVTTQVATPGHLGAARTAVRVPPSLTDEPLQPRPMSASAS